MARNDDESLYFDLTSVFEHGLRFFGTVYNGSYVNTNGNVTFGEPLRDYTPSEITGVTGSPIIAPFWSDIDTRDGAEVPSAAIVLDLDTQADVVTVTWPGVNAYSRQGETQNYFQLQFFDRGSGDFDIVFRYEDIQWAYDPVARAGYNANDGTHAFELPQSGSAAAVLDLENVIGNSGVRGLWIFGVRGGQVVPNAAPIADDDNYSVRAGGTLSIGAAQGVLVGDIDPEGAALSAAVATGPQHGRLVLQANGSFTYTPNEGFSGTDSFTYRATDGTLTDEGRVTVQVLHNERPNAAADAYVVKNSQALAVDAGHGVLANDRDADHDALSATLVTGPQHGSLSLRADGSFTYTPVAGFAGTDTFTYRASDGALNNQATVTLTVEPKPLALTTPAALAPGQTGTATLTYLGAAGTGPALAYVKADGALVADPVTGLLSDGAFVFVSPGAATQLTVKMASSEHSSSLSAAIADTATVIDWASKAASLRPDGLSDAAWSKAFTAFQLAGGPTVGSFVAELSESAARLSSFGIGKGSASAALAFEFEQALDFGSLAARSQQGSLGTGWAFLGDLGLAVDADGDAVLHGFANFDALSLLDARAVASYTLSSSVDRGVDLGGTLTTAVPANVTFARDVAGHYSGGAALGATLTKTASGYALTADDGRVMRFDAAGRLVDMTDALGRRTVATYDAAGHMTRLSGPDGKALTFQLDAAGKVTRIVDDAGHAVALSYGADGKLAGATSPGGTASFGYSAGGDLASAQAAGDPALAFGYDASGRLASISAGPAGSERYAYDGAGGYTVTDAAGHSTTVQLLLGGIAGRVTDANGQSSRLVYDAAGKLTGVAGPDGSKTLLGFDAAGRVVSVTDGNGAKLGFTYAGEGTQPVSFTDADGHARTFTYNEAGQITKATWPDGTFLAFSFDAGGHLVQSTNRRGETTTYSYDAKGNVVGASHTDAGAATYSYDSAGHLTKTTTPAGDTLIAYDAAGRVTGIDYANGRSLDYAYDAAGRRTSMTDGDGHATHYEYDAAGRLASVSDGGANKVEYSYDRAGNLLKEENSNGTATDYSYDAGGRLTAIVNHAAGGAVSSEFHYSYNAAGLRSGMATSDGAWTYGYDRAGQLVSAHFDSTRAGVADTTIAYTYDAAGNRLTSTENGVTTRYAANGLNQYTSAGGDALTYDASGNMVSKTGPGGTWTYSYNEDNRLTKVVDGDGSVSTYEYDAFGNRSAVTVDGVRTEFLVDPFGYGDVVGEYGAGGSSAQYLHGLGLAARIGADGRGAFYDLDAVASVTGVTGANGTLANSYGYTPFGKTLWESEGIANSFEFNGGLGVSEDANGLIYMRARSYDVELGRFTTEDPLWLNGSPENLYDFSIGNPISYTDPTGKAVEISVHFRPTLLPTGADHSYIVVRGDNGSNYFEGQKTGSKLHAESGPYVAGSSDSFPLNDAKVVLYQNPFDSADDWISKLNDYSLKINNENINYGYYWKQNCNAFSAGALRSLGFGLNENELPPGVWAPAWDLPLTIPHVGASDGDPHLTTFDGLAYDFQAVGEFRLVRGNGFEIQVRQEALGTNASINTATAMRLGDDVVGVYAKGTNHLLINGEAVTLEVGETIAVGGGSIHRYSYADFETYEVTDAKGNGFWVNVYGGANHLRPFVAADQAGKVSGLLGNANGSEADDMKLANGTALGTTIAAQVLYGAFADSWRITQDKSLFVYGAGQSTETFTDRGFPRSVPTYETLDPAVRAAAEAVVRAAGVPQGTQAFKNAVLDVALTGNAAFAEVAAEAPAPDEEPTPVVVQRPPVAVADRGATDEDIRVTLDVLANDTDPEGDALTLVGGSDPQGGTIAISNNKLVFTPYLNFNGATTLRYSVADGRGNTVDGSVAVAIRSVNDAPALAGSKAQLAAGTEDTAYVVSAANLLAGFVDVDGDALSVVNLSADHGTVKANGNGTFTITPAANFNGALNLSYGVSDGTLTTAATQRLTLTPVNDAPALTGAKAQLAAGKEDTAYVVSAANLLTGFADVDGDALSVVNLAADHGTVKANGNGTFTIAPAANFNGALNLSYGVSDGTVATAATQRVTVTPVNDAPALTGPKAQLAAGTEDTAYVVSAANLLAGFRDVDGDALSVVNLAADHGTVKANGNGTFTITPAANFNGALNLSYGVSDGTVATAATQRVTLAAVNDVPALTGAKAQLTAGTEDTAYVVSAANLLAGFVDVDGNALSVVNLAADHGAVKANGNGTFTITPAANFNGALNLSYGVSDGTLTTAATQRLTVTPVNDAPRLSHALPDRSATEDQAVGFTLPANSFTDIDSGALAWSAKLKNGAPLPSWLTFNAAHSFSGQPPHNFNGKLAITVTASDGALAASDTFTLTVAAVNDAPAITSGKGAAKASYTVAENKHAVALLRAADPDSSGLSWSLGGADAKLFALDQSGALSFKSAPDFETPKDAGKNNTYNVTVSVSDGGLSDAQALSIKVANVKGLSKGGTTEADKLKGTGEEDVLNGKKGDDTLYGYGGKDTLTGGGGDDAFVFNTKLRKSNVDTITDFSHADDTIRLDDDIFAKAGHVPSSDKDGQVALKSSAFWASNSGKAHDKSDRILYDLTDGHLYYDADGTGKIKAVQFADLDAHLALKANDFLLIA